MVYYVTLNDKDLQYCNRLDIARSCVRYHALTKKIKGTYKIQAFTGKYHGSGGSLKYTLQYDEKNDLFERIE